MIARIVVVLMILAAAGRGGGGLEPLDADALARCGSRGAPVTLTMLIEVFRANGITLEIDPKKCPSPASDKTNPDSTNGRPSGVQLPRLAQSRDSRVFCRVAGVPRASNREVEVVKYPTDVETHVGVLNVGCAVYPYDAPSEAALIERVKKALEALVLKTP